MCNHHQIYRSATTATTATTRPPDTLPSCRHRTGFPTRVVLTPSMPVSGPRGGRPETRGIPRPSII
ncbi:Protein of unknown function [Pyronema omphalodes CBS 100304]|uniref:Uncharacterized protein n=1 Tax=Pyronema omphalodes (strain CBS 100304) TaxID=1076935 RepID=U4LGP3_PYROM|nr:Protein of unknown function [Pyronema omphalodes CBS 100304]